VPHASLAVKGIEFMEGMSETGFLETSGIDSISPSPSVNKGVANRE